MVTYVKICIEWRSCMYVVKFGCCDQTVATTLGCLWQQLLRPSLQQLHQVLHGTAHPWYCLQFGCNIHHGGNTCNNRRPTLASAGSRASPSKCPAWAQCQKHQTQRGCWSLFWILFLNDADHALVLPSVFRFGVGYMALESCCSYTDIARLWIHCSTNSGYKWWELHTVQMDVEGLGCKHQEKSETSLQL